MAWGSGHSGDRLPGPEPALLSQLSLVTTLANMPHTMLSNGDQTQHWPHNVGIIAMDIYFPHQFVDQVHHYQNNIDK